MRFNVLLCISIFILPIVFPTTNVFGMMISRQADRSLTKITHLVPSDPTSMRDLGLSPLFVTKETSMDPDLIKDITSALHNEGLSEASITAKINEMKFPGRVYRSFENGTFKKQQVPHTIDVPCVIDLGVYNGCNRKLIQIKGLDQGNLEAEIQFPDGLCAGHSLNNAYILQRYAKTGEVKYLKDLTDMNGAAEFILKNNIKNWLDIKEAREKLSEINRNLKDPNISIVSTVGLFDSNLDKHPAFEICFDKNEFDLTQKNKAIIQNGLQRNYFTHAIVIGDEEVKLDKGHYFTCAIIKALNEIHYVVVDTFPGGVYHLQDGSHEKNRLMFLIQNIEQGFSTINLPNVHMLEYEKMIQEEKKENERKQYAIQQQQ